MTEIKNNKGNQKMPGWMEQIQFTTFLFWKDPYSLDWKQTIALFPLSGILLYFARLPFAGIKNSLPGSAIILMFQFIAVVVFLILGANNWKISEMCPKFLRLLILHLILVLFIIVTNNFYQWADSLSPMITYLIGSMIATILFFIYTLKKRSKKIFREWKFYLTVLIVTSVNMLVVFYFIIPQPGR